MEKLVESRLPSEFGAYRIMAFGQEGEGHPHLALVRVQEASEPTQRSTNDIWNVRVHSECMTGDVFGSKRCECGPQLHQALGMISASPAPGALIYLRQEGRGIGLVEKLRAYNLQDEGLDTFAANRALGHPDDARSYEPAVAILNALGAKRIRLLTNNPEKVEALREAGIDVIERLEVMIDSTPESEAYLTAKKLAGHWLI